MRDARSGEQAPDSDGGYALAVSISLAAGPRMRERERISVRREAVKCVFIVRWDMTEAECEYEIVRERLYIPAREMLL